MALNTERYMNNTSLLAQLKTKPNSQNSDRFIEWISLFCGTNISGSINDLLKVEIMRLVQVNSWASSWHLFGICNALNITIQQIYPRKISELRDTMQHLLLSNTIFCDSNSETSIIFN